jgi:hypothetical protein
MAGLGRGKSVSLEQCEKGDPPLSAPTHFELRGRNSRRYFGVNLVSKHGDFRGFCRFSQLFRLAVNTLRILPFHGMEQVVDSIPAWRLAMHVLATAGLLLVALRSRDVNTSLLEFYGSNLSGQVEFSACTLRLIFGNFTVQ